MFWKGRTAILGREEPAEGAVVSSLYIYAAGVYAWLAAFTVYRRTRRAPAPEQAEFVAQPQTSQSSAVVTTLDPRADDTQ